MIGYLKRATNKLGQNLIGYFFQGDRRAASPAIKIGSITGLPLILLMGCFAGALPNLAAASTDAPTPPKLLFKSNFGYGVSLGKPYSSIDGKPQYDFNSKGIYQNLTGKDMTTGYTWPPVAALGANFSGVQLIAPVLVTPSTLSDFNIARIYGTYGPNGGQTTELFLNTVNNGGVGNHNSAQTDFLIRRPYNIGDITNLYTTYWVKLQANLVESLDPHVSSGNWKTLTEFKTGGEINPVTGKQDGGGDYRIQIAIMKNTEGKLYWLTAADDGANRIERGPDGKEIHCPDPTSVVCPKIVPYWRVENHTVPVPVGRWAKVEVYWHRSSGADGRYWAAVNGQVIADYHGSTMGKFNLPITRIFSTLDYSGGHPSPNAGQSSGTHTTGLEFWDGFPCGDGVSCY